MPEETTKSSRSVTFPLLIAVVAALVAGIMFTVSGAGKPAETPNQGAQRTSGESNPFADLARRTPNDPTARGDVDAPVVMIMYSDFQCQYCGKFARDTAPALIKKYVDEGVVRIEWRDFPYLGNESTYAAKAARAAGDQGKFWQYHDALYADPQPTNSGALTEEFLAGVAKKLGLNVSEFRKTMNSDAVSTAVQADFQEGQKIGVNGTPAFLINGDPLIGAQPIGEFEKAIESAADEAK